MRGTMHTEVEEREIVLKDSEPMTGKFLFSVNLSGVDFAQVQKTRIEEQTGMNFYFETIVIKIG